MSQPQSEENFWSKVELIPFHTCWEWVGSKDKDGYGKFYFHGKYYRPHRFSWELEHKEKIPNGLVIAHSCDNPGCVNPNHLTACTQRENIQEAYDKGRKHSRFWNVEFCKHGHYFDFKNTRIYFRKKGSLERVCRQCENIKKKRKRTEFNKCQK